MSKLICRRCGSATDGYICSACARDLAAAIASMPALIRDLQVTAARMDNLAGTGAALMAIRPVQYGPQKGEPRVWDEWMDEAADSDTERTIGRTPSLRPTGGRIALPVTGWAFAPDATDLLHVARGTLVTWARHIASTRGADRQLDDVMARAQPAAQGPWHAQCRHSSCRAIRTLRPVTQDQWLAMWLIRVVDSVRLDEAAAEMVDEFDWLVKAIERATDRREPDLFAGTCDKPDVTVEITDDGRITPLVPLCKWSQALHGTHRDYHHNKPCPAVCGAELFYRFEDTQIRCRACGATYPVTDRKQQLLESAAEVWAGAALIANALSDWDLAVTRVQINVWAHRAAQRKAAGRPPVEGDFHQVSTDDNGDPLYRFGDVRARVDLARAAARQRQAEQAVNRNARGRVTA